MKPKKYIIKKHYKYITTEVVEGVSMETARRSDLRDDSIEIKGNRSYLVHYEVVKEYED